MAVWLDARIKVLPYKRQELLRTLAAMEEKTSEMGCQQCHYRRDQEDENLIRLTVAWKNREMLDKYLASRPYGILMGALQVLCEAPVITFRAESGLA